MVYDCVELGADRLIIEIDEEPFNDLLTVTITNNINRQTAHNSSHKPSSVIPLLRQVCDRCEGRLVIDHTDSGSRLTASMRYSHADRPPMGSMPGLIQEIIMSEPHVDISYTHRYNGREYRISTLIIHSMLDGVPMDTPSVSPWMKEMIGEGLARIMQGKDLP